jgi:hypothetical protein
MHMTMHAMFSLSPSVCYRFSFAVVLQQKIVPFMLSPWLPSAVRNPIFVDFDSTSAESHEIPCCLCLNLTKQLQPWLVMTNFYLNFVATNALFLLSAIFLFSSEQMAQVLVRLSLVGNLCSWHDHTFENFRATPFFSLQIFLEPRCPSSFLTASLLLGSIIFDTIHKFNTNLI